LGLELRLGLGLGLGLVVLPRESQKKETVSNNSATTAVGCTVPTTPILSRGSIQKVADRTAGGRPGRYTSVTSLNSMEPSLCVYKTNTKKTNGTTQEHEYRHGNQEGQAKPTTTERKPSCFSPALGS
jgi:hypothetical protein